MFEALRAERTRLAKAQGVPPYVVFHDVDAARHGAGPVPPRLAKCCALPGIGQAKLERYGAEFLAVLARLTPSRT